MPKEMKLMAERNGEVTCNIIKKKGNYPYSFLWMSLDFLLQKIQKLDSQN